VLPHTRFSNTQHNISFQEWWCPSFHLFSITQKPQHFTTPTATSKLHVLCKGKVLYLLKYFFIYYEFKMFKTVVAFLLGLLLFLVYYLRDCTGFECSATNRIFFISPVIFIARNSITRWFLGTHIPRYRRNDRFIQQLFTAQGTGLIRTCTSLLLLNDSPLFNIISNFNATPGAGVPQSVHYLTTDWMTGVRSPAEAKDISSSFCIQTSSDAHTAPYPTGT
jgi:hypothetical protein